MKKLASVLLSVVMLMSVLCMSALAIGEDDYLETTVTTYSNIGPIFVTFDATKATTNGKIAVEFDASRLRFEMGEVNGIIVDTSVDKGRVTVSYATTSSEAIAAGETLFTLMFHVVGHPKSADLSVTILEFNAQEKLNVTLPSISIDLSGDDSEPIPGPVNPKPPVDDPDDGKEDEGKDDETKPGINLNVPELTEEKYNSIVAKYPDAQNHWAEEAIVKAVNAGLFNGTGDNTFTPNGNVTRGMFAELLYRLSGKPAVDGNMPFSDVTTSNYYYNAVIWAYSNGIVTGVSDTEFAPEAKVSREQMVTMLYRFAKFINDDVTASTSLKGFADNAAVNSWAVEAMSWAVAEGIITGADGKLSPADNSTRAQVATILVRYAGL